MASDLTKQDLPRPAAAVWHAYLDEWDRSLRTRNKPLTTRYNYELAVTQLATFLSSLPADDTDAVDDPTDVQQRHIELFIIWMIESRSAATALNKYKVIQQFFKYLVVEGEITNHPMAKMSQPTTQKKLVPIVHDDAIGALLNTCAGKTFLERRDTAIIRSLMDSGGRLTEVTCMNLDEVDLKRDLFLLHGKGNKDRTVPFGEKTAQAITRYLRIRAKHKAASSPRLFLAAKGAKPLSPTGVKTMLRRRGAAAGITRMHAHRLRHTLAHEWQLAGGNQTDLMAIMGWESAEMLKRYGASAATVRAEHSHRTLALGNRV
jgi:integrase/recombinase XerC